MSENLNPGLLKLFSWGKTSQRATGCTGHLDNTLELRGMFILTKTRHFYLILPKLKGKTATRVNSGNFTTSFPPKPVKTVTDSNSSAKDLLNASLNAQIKQNLTEIEPNQSDIPKTPEKQPKSSQIPFPHEKPLDNKPKNVENFQLGCGKRARKPGGYYKNLEKGGGGSVAEASVAVSLDEDLDSGGVGTNLDE
jgi:Reverse transcriptase (RNA-dependent DNA polymerase)